MKVILLTATFEGKENWLQSKKLSKVTLNAPSNKHNNLSW